MKKVFKKGLSLLLAFAIIFSSAIVGLGEVDFGGLFAVNVSAASVYSLSFELNEDGNSYSITDCVTSASGELIIPDIYNSLPVTNIGDDAFEDCKNLTSIIISDSIQNIGYGAFSCCTSLTSITIPDSVTRIDFFAFYYCQNLTSVTIGNNVSSIGENAFGDCTSLASVNVSENNNYYCSVDGVLFSKDKTTLIKYPSNKISSEYIIPDEVINIDAAAFADCGGLTSIIIGNSVRKIGCSAFQGCQNLTLITIPDSVKRIETSAFKDTKYYNNSSNWENSVLYIGKHLITAKNFSKNNYEIKNGTKTIADYAFSGFYNLASITIPDSVTSIGEYVFDGTSYYNNSSNWENGVLYINNHLIKADASLNGKYKIKNGTKTIAVNAFYDCVNLTSVTIPSGVITLGDYAFDNCTSLTSITIPDSVTNIGDSAFCGCTKLTSITIPSGITTIGSRTFSCTNLTSITIPNSVKSIGEGTFYYCQKLTSVTIGNSVASIGDKAFDNCTSLASVNVSENNNYYCSVDGVLFSKDKTTLIKYPSRKTSSKYIIPDDVTNISSSAFSWCYNLTSITIPNSVTLIGECAFWECTKLKYVYYLGLLNDWSNITIGISNDCLINAIITHSCSFENDWIVENEPTCNNTGSKYNNCLFCNKTYIQSIPATGHTNKIWVTEKESTCTKEGYKDEYCLDCGELLATEIIPVAGHKNKMWVTEQEPTCVTEGYKDEYCVDCGELINTEVIPATGHNYEEWIIDIEPTCTSSGSKHSICSVCGDVVSETITASGHSYSEEWTIDVVPTCTNEGSKSHHCTGCDEVVADVTVIVPLGHDYEFVSISEEHPHIKLFKCSRCPNTKQEDSISDICTLCNFTFENVDDTTCKITGYLGVSDLFVMPSAISGRTVITTTTGAFKNNTTLTSVKIEDGVQGLGALSFLGCKSLSKIIIPESVTSIGVNAFYNCASDFTIYCFRGSYAMQYAVNNSLNYVIMDVGETENCTIDYENELIFVSIDGLTSIDDILYVPTNSMVSAEASHVVGNHEFLGTGSIVTVIDGNDISSEYTLIVSGDTNGDSICDALDCFQVERAANGNAELTDVYAMAADSNYDDVVDITDYQAIVNKALAS